MVTFASERKPIHIVNTRHSTITHKRYISHEIRGEGGKLNAFLRRARAEEPCCCCDCLAVPSSPPLRLGRRLFVLVFSALSRSFHSWPERTSEREPRSSGISPRRAQRTCPGRITHTHRETRVGNRAETLSLSKEGEGERVAIAGRRERERETRTPAPRT